MKLKEIDEDQETDEENLEGSQQFLIEALKVVEREMTHVPMFKELLENASVFERIKSK
jgi:hypothetical protein